MALKTTEKLTQILKGCVGFFKIFLPNGSPSKTIENVFYFI